MEDVGEEFLDCIVSFKVRERTHSCLSPIFRFSRMVEKCYSKRKFYRTMNLYDGKRTTRTTDGVSHLVGFPLFFLNLFFSYKCWLVDHLLIVNIVNKVIYRGVKLLCLLI